eukprot:g2445.t1
MNTSMTTPATKEPFSPTEKPSISLLRTASNRSPEMTGMEYSQDKVKSLEDAIKATDVSATCQILQLVKEEFSKKCQNQWPPDQLRRIWNCAINVLKDKATREARVFACQLIETLSENSKSCWNNEKTVEFQFDVEAPSEMVRVLRQCGHDLELRSLLLKTLLSLSRCSNCRSTYDPTRQLLLRQSEVIPALMESLNVLIHLTTRMPFDPNGHRAARLAIADAVQALHYTCFMNKENLKALAALDGFRTVKMSIEDNLNELTVQEHGCMIISELAISTELTEEEIMECVSTVTNVARVQIQEKYIEVARAAIWSLYRIASCVLDPTKRGNSPSGEQCEVGRGTLLNHIWSVVMKGETFNLVLGMMQSCQLKNDLLVKHCLDFISVVVSGSIEPSSYNSELIQNLQKAYYLVYKLFQETTDTGIKAVSLRTLNCLVSHPCLFGQVEESLAELDTFIECINLVKKNPQSSKTDIFLIQVFALNIISAFIEKLSYRDLVIKLSQISQYKQDIFSIVGFIIQYIEGGEGLHAQHSIKEAVSMNLTDQSCYKYDCHSFQHEPCKKSKMLNSVLTALELLSISGDGNLNITDNEGFGILHKLAKTGLDSILKGVMKVYGNDMDLSQTTKDGKTALQLALDGHHSLCASILTSESGTPKMEARNESLQSPDHQTKESTSVQQQQQKLCIRREKTKQVINLFSNSDESMFFFFFFREPTPSSGSPVLHTPDQDITQSSSAQMRLNSSPHFDQFENSTVDNVGHRRRSESVGQNTLWPVCDESRLLKKSSSSKSATTTVTVCANLNESTPVQYQQSFGTSLSAGSRYNNYTAWAPAGPYEESTSLDPINDRKTGSSEDRTSGNWQSLYNEEPLPFGGPKEKWSMVSSSSGQNNQASTDQSSDTTAIDRGLTVWPITGQRPRTVTEEDMPPAWQGRGGTQRILEQQQQQEHGMEEDLTDDKQILSWMSSEIFGLIGSGPEDTEDVIKQKSVYFENEQISAPLQGLTDNFDNLEEPSCSSFLAIDQTVSPFYSPKPSNAVPYIQGASPHLQIPYPAPASPWMNPPMVSPPSVPGPDPRLMVSRSDLRMTEGVHPSRFWHTEENDIPSKHLWLGNLNTRLPRSVLKSIFEEYGPIEDVVTFPGRMYAFVNFIHPENAQQAAKELDNLSLPVLTGSRKLVIKFRPNRKALGRVGDLMPGVASIESTNEGGGGGLISPSISVPVYCSQETTTVASSTPFQSNHPVLEQASEELHHTNSLPEEDSDPERTNTQMPPSRHLWLGNVCLRPSKIVLFSLFSRYGPVQSVRVFPGKTFAFVNFCSKEHSAKAKEALDQKVLEPITGAKPLVVRFQREGNGQCPWTRTSPENVSGFTPLQSSDPVVTDSVPLSQPDLTKSYMMSLPGSLDDDLRTQQGTMESMGTTQYQQNVWNETGKPYGLMSGVEMAQMGELVHSQSAAAAYGRVQNRSLDLSLSFQSSQQGLNERLPPVQTPWSQTLLTDGCFTGDSSMISNPDYGLSLPSSFSGGPDGKGYFTPFRNPHFPPSQSWNASEKIAGVPSMIDQNSMSMTLLSGEQQQQQQQQYQAQHQHFTNPSSHVGVHSSLPEEILVTNNSTSQFVAENYETQISPAPETTQASMLMMHHTGSIW